MCVRVYVRGICNKINCDKDYLSHLVKYLLKFIHQLYNFFYFLYFLSPFRYANFLVLYNISQCFV